MSSAHSHQMYISSSHRTPFSRYSNTNSSSIRCLRSSTPSMGYYKQSTATIDEDNSNRYRKQQRCWSDELRSNYYETEDTSNSLYTEKTSNNYDISVTSNDQRRHSSRPLRHGPVTPSWQEPSVATSSSGVSNLEARTRHYYRDAATPSRCTPSYSYDVKSPTRYLAANLSTAIYSKKSADCSGDAYCTLENGLRMGREWSRSPSRELTDELCTPISATSASFSSRYVPRELRIAQNTLDFVLNYSPAKMKSRQGYGKPFFETPCVIGI